MTTGLFRLIAVFAFVGSGAALAADVPLIAKRYPVADLVCPWTTTSDRSLPALGVFRPVNPIQTLTAPQMMPMAPRPGDLLQVTAIQPPAVPPSARIHAARLARLIATYAFPHTWADVGGAGTIAFDEPHMTLVVVQSADVHARLDELLSALRKLQQMPSVVMEMQVVEVNPQGYMRIERLARDMGFDSIQPTFISETPAAMTLFDKLATSGHSETLSRPKLMVSDGQQAFFQLSQTSELLTGKLLLATPSGVVQQPRYDAVDVGMRISVTPQVAADKRKVNLHLQYDSSALANGRGIVLEGGLTVPGVSTQSIQSSMVIPFGQTAIVAVGTTDAEQSVVSKCELNVPCLGPIPVMLDRVRIKVPMRRMLVVTPRLIVSAEEERTICPACEAKTLVDAYKIACQEGRTEDAMKLAMKALAADPKCFIAK